MEMLAVSGGSCGMWRKVLTVRQRRAIRVAKKACNCLIFHAIANEIVRYVAESNMHKSVVESFRLEEL
jgi:hypothetical protein